MYFKEKIYENIIKFFAYLTIFITIGIIGVLLFETIEFFEEVSLYSFLFDKKWTPLFAEKHFGILPLLSGTFLTSIIALSIAIPFGLVIAIFLSEYVSQNLRKTLKPFLEILAGVPTVVYGYFALLTITPILKKIFPSISTFNGLSAGIIMGFMIIPIIASLSDDALNSVPQSLREGAYALGSSKYEVSLKIVFPAAFSGIASAVILGLSRAIGETMVVAIAAGQMPNLTINPLESVETITAYIVQVSLGDTPVGSIEYKTIFVCGMVLFLTTFIFNFLSFYLRKSFEKKYGK